MFLENMVADGVHHVRPHLGDRPGRIVTEIVENHLRKGVGALAVGMLQPAREQAEHIVQDLKRRGFKTVHSRTNLDIEAEERDR
jgi:superfamily I DNA and/or RNA helicase